MSEIIKGFKVFNPDWTCSPNGNTKQYTCPGKFEEDVTPVRCGQGMHFCKVAADCFNYYDFNPDNHVAEVAAYGEVVEEGDKCATNKLEIIREIPWAELLEMVNTGKGCAGLCNSGDCNSGDWNSGNRNSGNRNSGDCNSGDWNSGDCNSGDWNSGDWNSGDCNSGDWNNTNFSNGCFNTVEPKIHLFNKPSEWTYRDWLNSDARYLLNQIPGDVLEYIWFENMTDEEKEVHPEAETTGGYLKELDNSECAVIWWRSLDQRKKNVIMAIPNFDKAIFKEITGIDVDAD
ncbi:pentapeptide repeat-containing protein [Faecalibacterium prausnitzii]|uniref:pentapeptide repeat-containing protein n=1 Tax=Faecalibacterium prausnitzii TaxID=853 RepID=UPI0012B12184|nr:pentapeptide repeat-containing protein [Faecalibacterium prausnitzii]